MRVLYIGMYSEDGLQGLESSSLAKRRDAAASIAKAAGGELLDLMYLQVIAIWRPFWSCQPKRLLEAY